MPKYKVDTDQGSFIVEMDQPPSDMAQMRDLLTQHVISENKKFVSEGNQTASQLAAGPERRAAPPMDQILTPQQLEQRVTPGGFAQPPAVASTPQVFETLNAPIDYVADQAGRLAQHLVGPNENPRTSDIAGGLTKAVVQYAGPQAAIKSLGLAGKLASKFIPGVEGGQMESKIGKAGDVLKSGLGESTAQANLYKRLNNMISPDDRHPLTSTQRLLNKIIGEDAARGIVDSPIVQDAKRILGVIEKNGGGYPTRSLDTELSSIGEKTKVIAQGQPVDQRYKQIFASMATDMENRTPQLVGTHTEYAGSPTVRTIGQKEVTTTQPRDKYAPDNQPAIKTTTPGSQSLVMDFGQPRQVEEVIKPTSAGQLIRAKDVAVRRQKGFEDLIEEFTGLVKTKRGQAGAQDMNANQLIDRLKSNDKIKDSLTAEDWKQIDPILRDLADMKVLPSPKGANFGSGRSLILGSAGYLGAQMAGIDPATTAAATTVLSNVVGRALMTEGGRNLVKAIIKAKDYTSSQKINLINGIGRLTEKGMKASFGEGQ